MVDGFAVGMLVAVGAVLLVLWLIGTRTPGTGSERLGLDAREIEERRISLELEDEMQVREALAELRARRAEREAREAEAGSDAD